PLVVAQRCETSRVAGDNSFEPVAADADQAGAVDNVDGREIFGGDAVRTRSRDRDVELGADDDVPALGPGRGLCKSERDVQPVLRLGARALGDLERKRDLRALRWPDRQLRTWNSSLLNRDSVLGQRPFERVTVKPRE